MITKKHLFVVFGILLLSIANAQVPFFKKGSRVCFVGNSITHNGEFHHHILKYYVTRYPLEEVSFYNCGIPGDIVNGILQRLDTDIFIHQPTHAIIMIGMNDIRRNLYNANANKHPDTIRLQKAALDLYEKNLDSLIRRFLQKQIEVILQAPSPYDQTATIAESNAFGANDALQKCTELMRAFAQKYQLRFVDYWTPLSKITHQIQQKTPSATLTVGDRIHPNSTGHTLMAYEFLKSTNASSIVSEMVFDIKNNKVNAANSNDATIKKVRFQKGTLKATVLERALPFPYTEAQKSALELVPFTQDLNRQLLQVKGLAIGSYQISIDHTIIDTITNDALEKGINLTVYSNTPQYQQALQVQNLLQQLWATESNIRAVAYIGFQHLRNFPFVTDLAKTRSYLDSLYQKRFKGNQWYASNFAKYLRYYPQVNDLLKTTDSLRKAIYKAAKPIPHQFKIIPLNTGITSNVNQLISASQAGAMPLYFDANPTYALNSIDSFNHPKEYFIRRGLPNFVHRLQHQKNASIGFIGGSITRADNQYRQQIINYLQAQFPTCQLKGINAGVSGTGSDLGACRLKEQILQYHPDLIFVEFAVNGGSAASIEGIVRQIWKQLPNTDICFVYTVAGNQYQMYYPGNEITGFIKTMEQIADFYQIPSVHMGLYPALLEQQNKLVWKSSVSVPEKITFSSDGVHPTTAGGNLYAQSIARTFTQLLANPSTPEKHILPAPINTNNWEDAAMFSPTKIANYNSDWKLINPEKISHLAPFTPWFSEVLTSNKAAAAINFRFKGDAFGIFDIGGPEVGQLEIWIDGKPLKTNAEGEPYVLNRFNTYCNNRYRGQYELFTVANEEHTVTLKIATQKADKTAILGSANLADYQANPNKYNQQTIYIGKILIKGVIIK